MGLHNQPLAKTHADLASARTNLYICLCVLHIQSTSDYLFFI